MTKRDIRFLIDRLAARFGAHRILAFQPNDTHIPEAAWVAVPAQYAQSPKLTWAKIRREQECAAPSLAAFRKARTRQCFVRRRLAAAFALAQSAACRHID